MWLYSHVRCTAKCTMYSSMLDAKLNVAYKCQSRMQIPTWDVKCNVGCKAQYGMKYYVGFTTECGM